MTVLAGRSRQHGYRKYNDNTPLGFRTGTVTFLINGGTSPRASIGFKEGNYADNMTLHEIP